MTIAFVANLDAELELVDPDHRPSTRMVANLVARAEAFALQLGTDVVTIVPGRPLGRTVPQGAPGVCWCPTPRALERLAACGARTPPAPPLAVLQRVNHRAFASALQSTLPSGALWEALPGACFVHTLDELRAHLATLPIEREILLKRPFGFAGRGRKRLPRADGLAGPALVWAEASMLGYGRGLAVEPFVEVRLDVALHGIVWRGGGHALGAPTLQTIDHAGAWIGSRLAAATDLVAAERAALVDTGGRVALALADAGYFGPFGIDGYRWRDATGATHFHPLSEINARLSMGWCVGMGSSARRSLVEEA